MSENSNNITDEWDMIIKRLIENGKLVTSNTRGSSKITSKIKTMRDIIGVTPECFQKNFNQHNIQDSFARTGIISRSMKNKMVYIECPDIFVTMRQAKISWENFTVGSNKLIATSSNNNQSLWDHFVSHIPSAVNEFKKNYKLSEEWFDSNSFILDSTISGDDMIRNPTDFEYHMQRTMIVHNEKNREKLDSASKEEIKRYNQSLMQEYLRAEGHFSCNTECEKALRKNAKLNDDQPLSLCTIHDFQHVSVKKKFLLGFVKVRYSKDIFSDDSEIPTIKGSKQNIDDNDKDTLVYWAYTRRNDPIIAEHPDQPTLKENISRPMLDIQSVTFSGDNLNPRNDNKWILDGDYI